MSHSDRQAIHFGLGAVALWSTVATAFKLSLAHLSPLLLVTLAAAVSWVFFAAIISFRGDWRLVREAGTSGIARALATGALNPALYYWLLFGAFDRLPAQEAMALNYTWALTLPLLAAPLLGHTLTRSEMLAASVSYTGVFVIATRGQIQDFGIANPEGAAFALASTVVWALYWIANTRQKIDATVGLFLNFTGALPLLLVLVSATAPLSWQHLPLPGLLGALYVGFFEMGLSFVLWLAAMRLTRSTARISTLIFLAPPTSLALIWLILGEPILVSTLIGLGFILAGLWLQHRPKTDDDH